MVLDELNVKVAEPGGEGGGRREQGRCGRACLTKSPLAPTRFTCLFEVVRRVTTACAVRVVRVVRVVCGGKGRGWLAVVMETAVVVTAMEAVAMGIVAVMRVVASMVAVAMAMAVVTNQDKKIASEADKKTMHFRKWFHLVPCGTASA